METISTLEYLSNMKELGVHRHPMGSWPIRDSDGALTGTEAPGEVSVTVYFLGSLTLRVQREILHVRVSAGTPVEWLLETLSQTLPGFDPVMDEPDSFVVYVNGREVKGLDPIEEDASVILMPTAATLRGVRRHLYRATPCTVSLAK